MVFIILKKVDNKPLAQFVALALLETSSVSVVSFISGLDVLFLLVETSLVTVVSFVSSKILLDDVCAVTVEGVFIFFCPFCLF